MNYSDEKHNRHRGIIPFGKAVKHSGFARVCPLCFKQWSEETAWLRETEFVGTELTQAGSTIVRRHDCGGEMLSAGRIERLPKAS